MSITYDPQAKKWNIAYEKTDYQTDKPVNKTLEVWGKVEERTGYQKGNPFKFQVTTDFAVGVGINKDPKKGWVKLGDIPVKYKEKDLEKLNIPGEFFGPPDNLATAASEASAKIQEKNTTNEALNKENTLLNEANKSLNEKYNKANTIISATKGEDYLTQINALKELGIKDIQNNFDTFYLTEKVSPISLNAEDYKPLYGDFDATYYAETNPAVAEKWEAAVKSGDLDITARYGNKQNFLASHYALQGKRSGSRGNAPEMIKYANEYTERKPTDKDIEAARNLQLGVDINNQTDRILKVPEIAAAWEKAKEGDPYWKKLAKESFLDVNKKDDFVVLFRLSDRDEDKQIRLNYNVNTGYGITELEDALNTAVGAKATVDATKFAALTQNVLKDTIEEIKKAKAKEAEFDLLSGLGGVGEIININKTIADSLLVDSGIGAYASMVGDKSFNQDDLEKSLQNITGIQNNVTYNWQQWFDNTLKKKYEHEQEVAYQKETPEGVVKENIKVEAEFARNFITNYLQPRFDQSKSMNEFTEYLDVRQKEKNPFQTEDMVSAVSRLADLRAKEYLQNVESQAKTGRSFDVDFYFNPTGDAARQSLYESQAEQVSSDWEQAKNGDKYWAEQAYRFGVNVNDKEAFAKMHFEVKGQGQGFDPAEDFLTASKVKDFIYTKILPELNDEALKQKNIFGVFLLPEEFADDLLEGLDPNNPEQWQEVLKELNMGDFQGSIDELKEEIMNTVRTGSAEEIRQNIKYLQQKRLKPTQERLGVTYIERDEDNLEKDEKPETEFYQIFKDAGYKGTEEEFYTNVYPDADKEDMAVMSKLVTGKGLEFDFGKLTSDPFESLGTVQKLMGSLEDEEDEKTTSDTEEEGYFSLGLSDDEDEDYMSSTGKSILGGFTSFLK